MRHGFGLVVGADEVVGDGLALVLGILLDDALPRVLVAPVFKGVPFPALGTSALDIDVCVVGEL